MRIFIESNVYVCSKQFVISEETRRRRGKVTSSDEKEVALKVEVEFECFRASKDSRDSFNYLFNESESS